MTGTDFILNVRQGYVLQRSGEFFGASPDRYPLRFLSYLNDSAIWLASEAINGTLKLKCLGAHRCKKSDNLGKIFTNLVGEIYPEKHKM